MLKIVEIPIVTANANTGGVVQYTNDSSSGIYNDTGEVLEVFLVEKFPVPAVDTPTIVTLNHIIESPEGDANKNLKVIKMIQNLLEGKCYLYKMK